MFSTLRRFAEFAPTLKNVRFKQQAFVNCRGFSTRSVKIISQLSPEVSKFKICCNVPAKIIIINREFHTTNRRDIHPIFAVILKPALRIGSLLFGRAMKKWWRKKDAVERERYAAWFRERRLYFCGIFGAIFASFCTYILMHIEKTPITNRRRFMMFTDEQQVEFEKMMFQMHLEDTKEHILPVNHPIYRDIVAATERVLNGNKDVKLIKEKNWTLNVINLPARNAYVLPGGNIFIYAGMLQMVENIDQLSSIIAHEIAHAVLKHSMEKVSQEFLTSVLITLPIIFLWSIFPDLAAGFLHILGSEFLNVLHDRPYSRAIETEADEVGLTLAAKACVDVREVVVFWGMMRALKDLEPDPLDLEWLSTHPDHEKREKNLDAEMPKALALRSSSQCPALNSVDPRKKFYERSAKEIEANFKQRGIIHDSTINL